MKGMPTSWKSGLAKHWSQLSGKALLAYIPFLAALAFAALQTDAPIEELTRDIFVTAELPSYTGLISNLGILVWCAATAVCGLGYLLLKDTNETKACQFFICAGIFSCVLMLDDFFMFHELYYPAYFKLSEKVVFFIYGVILSAILIHFRSFIYRTPFVFLIIATIFFGISLFMDLIESIVFGEDVGILPTPLVLIEDGTKLLGIVSWCMYLTLLCVERSRRARWLH